MILKRFYEESLAQASYMVGCAATGSALIIDANRDVDQYIAAAAAENLRIEHVTETHIHADFLSGSRELAQKAGAMLYLSGEGGNDWKYAFASESSATLLKDGNSFMVGNIRIEAIHTPGHTPEHLSFILTDTPATSQPMGAFTGDFVFAGDVGRPDLLEKAAGVCGAKEPAARVLFQSLQRFKKMPDYLQIWPGHGAGSACGKGLGGVPSSTVGYERLANWAFAIEDEDAFVKEVLSGQPEPPRYFAMMKKMNKEGPTILGGILPPKQMELNTLVEVIASGALLVDARPAEVFRAGHIPGSLNIPLTKFFPTGAGWLIPYDRSFYLIVSDVQDALHAARALSLIGLDRCAITFVSRTIQAYTDKGGHLQTLWSMSAQELKEQWGNVNVLDVRGQHEYDQGHVVNAKLIPFGHLEQRVGEVPQDRTLAVHCHTGNRAAIASSILLRLGVDNIITVTDGFPAIEKVGVPVEHGS
jgi:hydroxyacylglutathione hydrolase